MRHLRRKLMARGAWLTWRCQYGLCPGTVLMDLNDLREPPSGSPLRGCGSIAGR